MKVLNLRCSGGHGFEGWFGSEADFLSQTERGLVACPLCGDSEVSRLPSAPRLNLSGARAPRADAVPPASEVPRQHPAETVTTPPWQAVLARTVQEILTHTEDVGERFAEEARRIHYGETQARGIRGQATPEQRAELDDEGIEVLSLPVPKGLKGPAH